jgi:hypothetical protein
MIKKHLARVALGCALATAMNFAFAQSVTNGSFESITDPLNGQGALQVNPGSTAITGWSVVGGSTNVSVIGNAKEVFFANFPLKVSHIKSRTIRGPVSYNA